LLVKKIKRFVESNKMKNIELDFHGTRISIETGKIAKQASGSVMVRAGETVVLVTACAGSTRDVDFFPLSVDYVEKAYAAGKIPGGFFKREGKLSDHEALTSRLIDRPCRPLFPKGYRRDVQVIATVMSADNVNNPDMLSLLGASAALGLSELPFEGPVAGVRVGRIDGKLVINPSMEDMARSDLALIVAGTENAIVMVEGSADQMPEEKLLEALFFAHKELQPLLAMQIELQTGEAKQKEVVKSIDDDELKKKIQAFVKGKIEAALKIEKKSDRALAIGELANSLRESMASETLADGDESRKSLLINRYYDKALSSAVRERVFNEGVRIDGRDTKTVRDISVEVGILPRVHGSALFTRGETQGIITVTLGTEQEAQRLDRLDGDSTKTFMLHYNFPAFCVGETKPLRGPGRREVGHGALAERAVSAVMPTIKEFPYVVRVVSEITESNGSSSMASVCGASMALMQAGVPIKAAVAGVAMGLLVDDATGRFAVLTDILGDEDHLGDMDFKVCGTAEGITAIQMDIKVKGLTKEIMTAALTQARDGRLHILKKMEEGITKPNTAMSEHAPRVVIIKINPDKVRDIIGPGGKMIRSITESCGVKIEISDDGSVSIASNKQKSVDAAVQVIEGLTQEVILGKLYEGVVKRIVDFGAFVEVIPGTDGLVHISQLSDDRVKLVTDVVQEGDIVWVKVLDIDRQGKIRLSLKDAIAERAGKEAH
jgi:polyribonucleotide nucleotidyltransferase